MSNGQAAEKRSDLNEEERRGEERMKGEKKEVEEGASRDGRGELPVKACGSGMNERTE